jgi:phosphoribosyl 1,2-cyclic phosphate phosphodiesterase
MEITLLGTGTSHGIPMVACDCPTCTSDDPRDRRTRTGVHLAYRGHGLLIDTPPELRLQCLQYEIQRVDAVFYTHAHADHVMGLDDLRRFNDLLGAALPCYGDPRTMHDLTRRFGYAFDPDPESPSSCPSLRAVSLEEPVTLFRDLTVVPVPVQHGTWTIHGYRIGPFAFLTDVNHIPDASRTLLEGLDVLVLDALRPTPHPTHFSLEEAVAEAQRIGARKTFFTHMTHELKHAETNTGLPAGMALAHDGLRLPF